MNVAEQNAIAELCEAMREGRADHTRQIAELKAVLIDRIVTTNERISALEGQVAAIRTVPVAVDEGAIVRILAAQQTTRDAAEYNALKRWTKTTLGAVLVVTISGIVKLVLG